MFSHGFHGFFHHEEHEEHEEKLDADFADLRSFLASFGVFGHTFPRSKLLRKARPYPPGHFSMPHLGNWLQIGVLLATKMHKMHEGTKK